GLTKLRLWNGSYAWLATRYEDVRQILGDNRFSHNPASPGMPHDSASREAVLKTEDRAMNFLDPPEHTRVRRAMAPMFSVRRVAETAPKVERIVREQLDAVVVKGPP